MDLDSAAGLFLGLYQKIKELVLKLTEIIALKIVPFENLGQYLLVLYVHGAYRGGGWKEKDVASGLGIFPPKLSKELVRHPPRPRAL